ncbi:MAG: hypothetical protein HY000_39560 [Planctomycetes bacterium]|nr:hypothetical protein [Planctomycetota bacterium]
MRLRGWSGAGAGAVAGCLALVCLLASGSRREILGLIARPERTQELPTVAELPEQSLWQVRLQLKVCELNRQPIPWLGETLARLSDNPLAARILRGDALSTEFKRFDADACLDALAGVGVLRSVCEPALVTLSGQQAIFQPLDDSDAPIVDEGDSPSEAKVQVVGLGAELCFRPTVVGADCLQLEVAGFPTTGSAETSSNERISQPAYCSVELRADEVLALSGRIQPPRQPKSGLIDLIKLPFGTRLSGDNRPAPKECELIVIVIPGLERIDSTVALRQE